VQDQGNYREYQEQVDESACHVKHGEAAKPSDQQNDEQYGPDAHLSFSSSFRIFEIPVTLRRMRHTPVQHDLA
jgi:hypothetical protein